MKTLRTLLSAALLMSVVGLAASESAAQAGSAVVQVQVKGSVEETLGKIRQSVANQGMMVMGEIHQGKVMAMTGLQVNSESLLIGSPTVGKQLFAADPGVGVVVPVRLNVYADGKGNTFVSYVMPSATLGTFSDPKVQEIAAMLDEKFWKMATMLAQ